MADLGPLGDVGPCQLNWAAGGTPTAIASIHEGGATFRFAMGFTDVHEAEHGVTPVDAVFTGFEQVEFEAPFTRITYANLAIIIPGSTQSGGESGNVEVYCNRVGTPMYDSAQELIVKRIVNGVVDTEQKHWLHLPKSYPVPQFDIPYTLDGQRAFMVLFKVFPDATSGLTWHIGDLGA